MQGSLNEGVELDNEILDSDREAGKVLDQQLFEEVVPGETPELAPELDILGMVSKIRDLDYAQINLQNIGGISQEIALEHFWLVPGLINDDCPVGFYSKDVTKTRFNYALEAIESEKKTVVQAIWEKLKDWIAKIIQRIKDLFDPVKKEKTFAVIKKFTDKSDSVLFFLREHAELVKDEDAYREKIARLIHGIRVSDVFELTNNVYLSTDNIEFSSTRLNLVPAFMQGPEVFREFNKGIEVGTKINDEIDRFCSARGSLETYEFKPDMHLVESLKACNESLKGISGSIGKPSPEKLIELLKFVNKTDSIPYFLENFCESAAGLMAYRVDFHRLNPDARSMLDVIDENIQTIHSLERELAHLSQICIRYEQERSWIAGTVHRRLKNYSEYVERFIKIAERLKNKDDRVDYEQLVKHLQPEVLKSLL